MPATAGRVRMPANNRVHSSAALQTHGIWQSAIGYDPYAPNKDESKSSSQPKASVNSASEPEGDNAYANFQGLLALARITGSNTDEARGSCKRCGRVGHLSFQCRNFLSVKDDIKEKEKDSDAIQAAVLSGLEKIKGGRRMGGKEESDEEEEESDEEDSEVDSEIERIIANKRRSSGGRSLKKKDDDDESESDGEGRKKRGRSKKRRSKKRESSDSEEDEEAKRKRRRKEKRRKKDDSSDEEEEENRRRRKRKSRKEKRRRRSHRYSDDSDSDTSEDSGRRHVRKSRKAASPSDSDASGSDDSRVGRGTKRSEMRSKKRHHD
ncbi:CAX-interacting protein 4 [Mercurialis annua]|uniref:CAX-interacting protein 4 n=1 Tax=Mercurialis annua TaxID=3986 RepID=UPI00215E777C|nr:CAX-interacting protein 4 [Mercurialis annua]